MSATVYLLTRTSEGHANILAALSDEAEAEAWADAGTRAENTHVTAEGEVSVEERWPEPVWTVESILIDDRGYLIDVAQDYLAEGVSTPAPSVRDI